MTFGLESVSKLQKGVSPKHWRVCAELQLYYGRDFLSFCGSKGAALARKSPKPKVGARALPKNELAPSLSGEFQLGTWARVFMRVCVLCERESAAIRKSNLINNEERPWGRLPLNIFLLACHARQGNNLLTSF
jgi:hypothetical protein